MLLSTNRDPEVERIVTFGNSAVQWRLYDDGTFTPIIRGADGDDDDKNDDDDKDPPEDDKSKDKGPLSQEEVKRIAAREKREGKTAGRKELLKALEVESEDDLKEIIAAHRQAQDARKSEADKAAEQATKDRTDAGAERAIAKREKNEGRCERALLKLELPEKIVAKAIGLMDIDLTDDIEMEDVTAAAEKLKEEMPQLFVADATSEEDKENGKNKESDPKKPPAKSKVQATNEEAAREMMALRHPAKKPVSTGSQGGT